MKAIVRTCDRCGAVEERRCETHIVEEWKPSAVRDGFGPSEPGGWWERCDDEKVEDVCPDCTTAGERADALFREVESNHIFGADEGV